MRAWLLASKLIVAVVLLGLGTAHASTRPVTVFLERNGRTLAQESSADVRIPRFGGGDRAWTGILTCVREHFAPFAVDVVDRRPAGRDFITAVVGGRASQLGLDDRWTNGVGPHSGQVIRNAIVFVFSRVGTGERDVANLCAVTAHEVAHALGLDHSYKCGDLMSYFLDRCGKREFLDFDSPCGEDNERACADGEPTQNSYRRLGALVGFREVEAAEPTEVEDEAEPEADDDSGQLAPDDDAAEPQDPYEVEAPAPQHHECGRRRRR